ncbi:MAG: hypothetical protein L0Z50_02345, partial [Verrucomicrobiales bacterium]|nr:hypothetical protein [Verrucomicrobiales bacterium]
SLRAADGSWWQCAQKIRGVLTPTLFAEVGRHSVWAVQRWQARRSAYGVTGPTLQVRGVGESSFAV